jgi:hypothetical protein
MGKTLLLLFYNDLYTTLGPGFGRQEYFRDILPALRRGPAKWPPILGWPVFAHLYKAGRYDKSKFLVRSLAAHLAAATRWRVSFDRRRLEKADAVLFHTPTFTAEMMRNLSKRPGQIWIGFSHECRLHYPLMTDPAYNARLDLRMDYRFESEVPAPYFSWDTLRVLRRPPAAKTADAPAAVFISSLTDGNNRLDYVRELMRHMPVNSYGRQLNNRVLEKDEGATTKNKVLARHKFTLAFENTSDHDYVTEKFFHPLIVGSVPVYLGAPNIRDFAPGEKCYIDAADFDSPKALADHLLALDRDDAAYAEYLEWKRRPFAAPFMKLAEAVREPNYVRLLRLVEARLSNHGRPV